MGKILVYVFHQYIQSTEVFHILPQILQAFVWFHFNFEVNVDFFGPKHFEIEWQTLYITELIELGFGVRNGCYPSNTDTNKFLNTLNFSSICHEEIHYFSTSATNLQYNLGCSNNSFLTKKLALLNPPQFFANRCYIFLNS